MLGIQTRGGRMAGADESTELWRHPQATAALIYQYFTGQYYEHSIIIKDDANVVGTFSQYNASMIIYDCRARR